MKMADWIWKKGKLIKKKTGNVLGFKKYQADNVVKVQKPDGFYIPIKVTVGIYQPSTKERIGSRTETLNVCNIAKYSAANIYGKPSIKLCIKSWDDTLLIEETAQQLDKMISDAVEKSKNGIAVRVINILKAQKKELSV